MDDTTSALTVSDVVTRVRQRPVLAVAPIMLGLLLSVAYVVLTAPTYVSTASVQVEPVTADRYATNINVANLISMPTEQQVVQSAEVAGRAAKELGIDQRTVRQSVSVSSPQNTLVLNITYVAGTPNAAFRGAQQVADSYLAYRKESKQATAQKQLATVQKNITELQAQIATRSTTALLDQLDGARAKKRDLELVLQNDGGEVISRANTPTGPASPKPLVAIPGGIGAGLIAGLALAVLWPARVRRRVVAPVPPGTPRPAGPPAAANGARAAVRPGVVPPAPARTPAPPARPG